MHMHAERPVTVAELGERDLVSRITNLLTRPAWVVIGPGDDAAVVESRPRTLEVLTTDAVVEGVHFDIRFTPPAAIGHRALAVNLSDIAAMGARPRAALVSLLLPRGFPVSDLDELMRGITTLAADARIAIVGGNVTASPGPLIVDVTATGYVHRRRVLTRGGARAGDDVYVTGTVGLAAIGLRLFQREHDAGTPTPALPLDAEQEARARQHYLRPSPRLRAGAALSDARAASACIDLSDGLADGVHRLADAAGLGITLDGEALPIDGAVFNWHGGDATAARTTALTGGDDYELLFAASPRARGRLRAAQRHFGDLPLTLIGRVTRSREVCMRTSAGVEAVPRGFSHFA